MTDLAPLTERIATERTNTERIAAERIAAERIGEVQPVRNDIQGYRSARDVERRAAANREGDAELTAAKKRLAGLLARDTPPDPEALPGTYFNALV